MGRKFHRIKVFTAGFGLVALTARLGSLFTARGVGTDWYENIRPEITPPDFVFPVVWAVLYLLLAVALSLAWLAHRGRRRTVLALLFGANLGLNVAWSYLYFARRDPPAAFAALLLLWLTIAAPMLLARRRCRAVFFLLLPYLLWVSFAGVLNFLSF